MVTKEPIFQVLSLRSFVLGLKGIKMTKSHAIRFMPNNPDATYYAERTDRNIGWITTDEQEILRQSIVGIAGTGGMGGLLAAILVRAGVGEIRIADTEVFDVSNINRQFAATRTSIGKSKALETAKQIRAISDDTSITVYPQGITEDSVDHFINGCSLICDEIELLAIDARTLLHAQARKFGISLFNCNSTGFGTNLFLYTPTSMAFEKRTGISYQEAKLLKSLAVSGDAEASSRIVHTMIRAVVPKLSEYSCVGKESDRDAFYQRLLTEQKVPILATNPAMAAGFLANRVLLYLLRDSGVKRNIIEIPEMPGYLFFDSALMQITICEKDWLTYGN